VTKAIKTKRIVVINVLKIVSSPLRKHKNMSISLPISWIRMLKEP
jgi:hypothetical protein